jgi:hypothetical protein
LIDAIVVNDYDLFETGELIDSVILLQPVVPPQGFSGSSPAITVDLSGPPATLPTTDLPAELMLDDWPDALIWFGDVNDTEGMYSSITAEIYSLMSVATPPLVGDYNDNDTVDAADYVVWRKGVGVEPTQENYNLWRTHFGQTAGSGSLADVTVPEPASALLLIVGAVAIRRERRIASQMTSTR